MSKTRKEKLTEFTNHYIACEYGLFPSDFKEKLYITPKGLVGLIAIMLEEWDALKEDEDEAMMDKALEDALR